MLLKICAVIASITVLFSKVYTRNVDNTIESFVETEQDTFVEEQEISKPNIPARLSVFGEIADDVWVTVCPYDDSILPFTEVFKLLGGTIAWTDETHAELSYNEEAYYLTLDGKDSSLSKGAIDNYLIEAPGTRNPYFKVLGRELYVEANRIRILFKSMGTKLKIIPDYENAMVYIDYLQ